MHFTLAFVFLLVIRNWAVGGRTLNTRPFVCRQRLWQAVECTARSVWGLKCQTVASLLLPLENKNYMWFIVFYFMPLILLSSMLNLFPLELLRPRINSLSLFLKLDSFNKCSELHCVEQVPFLVFKYRCSLLPLEPPDKNIFVCLW